MATDLERLDGAVGFLLSHSMDAAAVVVQTAVFELSALRAENERLRAELAACREALRVTDDPVPAGAAVPGRVDAVAGRIVGALCWTRHVDDSTDDSRRIARRYGELKRELPFDEAERRAKREFVASVIGEAVRSPRPE